MGKALEISERWKALRQAGLTAENFEAYMQSMEAMMENLHPTLLFTMALHTFFQESLPVSSDPIEGRFGWYRQVHGGNFYMSILQLFQTEKNVH